jgi:hypothetical protein
VDSDQGRVPGRRAAKKRGRRPSPELPLRSRFPHTYQQALDARDHEVILDLSGGESQLARRLAERRGGRVSRYLQQLEIKELRLRNEAMRDQSADVIDALSGLCPFMGSHTLMRSLEDPNPQRRAKAIYVLDTIALTPRAHVRPHKYEIVEKLLHDLNLDDLDIELIRTQLFTTNPKLERKELAERYNVSRQAVDQRLLKLIRRLAGMYQLDPIRSLVRSIRSRAISFDTYWYLDVRDPMVQFIEFDCRGEFPQPIDVIGFGVWLSQIEVEDPHIEQSMTEPTLANPTHWVRDMRGSLGVSGSPFELAIHPGDEDII